MDLVFSDLYNGSVEVGGFINSIMWLFFMFEGIVLVYGSFLFMVLLFIFFGVLCFVCCVCGKNVLDMFEIIISWDVVCFFIIVSCIFLGFYFFFKIFF